MLSFFVNLFSFCLSTQRGRQGGCCGADSEDLVGSLLTAEGVGIRWPLEVSSGMEIMPGRVGLGSTFGMLLPLRVFPSGTAAWVRLASAITAAMPKRTGADVGPGMPTLFVALPNVSASALSFFPGLLPLSPMLGVVFGS